MVLTSLLWTHVMDTFRTCYGVDNFRIRIPKNNIMGALRKVFFFANTVHIDSELLAWAATFNSL